MDLNDFCFSPLTPFIFFTFLWTSTDAQPQVVGSIQPIIAAPGDDVILPCHLEPLFNVEDLTVVWSKSDLRPDSDRVSRVDGVYYYWDRREVLDIKSKSYIGRTELFTDELKHGNISLKIINVTLADRGRYRCFIPNLNSRVKDSIIQLVVETPQKPREPLTPGPNEEENLTARFSRNHLIPVMVFCIVLILGVILGVGFLLKHKDQK